MDVRQGECREGLVAGRVHAQHPEPERGAVPPQRLVEREAPVEVAVIEVGAEVVHHSPAAARGRQSLITSPTLRACSSAICGCIGRLNISRASRSVLDRSPKTSTEPDRYAGCM